MTSPTLASPPVPTRTNPPVVPLTTLFTPPASCFTNLYNKGTWIGLGSGLLTYDYGSPMDRDECFPPQFANFYGVSSGLYYSPELCPSGYASPATRPPNSYLLSETGV